jgi:hypothetical protein
MWAGSKSEIRISDDRPRPTPKHKSVMDLSGCHTTLQLRYYWKLMPMVWSDLDVNCLAVYAERTTPDFYPPIMSREDLGC